VKWDLDKQNDGPTELEIAGDLTLDLGEGSPERAGLNGVLSIQDMESRVLIKGKLEATGQASCARCLNEFSLTWSVSVEMMILRSQFTGKTRADKEGADEEEGSSIVVAQRKGVADLQPGLRECTLLAYPQSALCREDCRGICVTCGAELNETDCDCSQESTDPRWDALP